MKNLTSLLIWSVIIGAAFLFAWRSGWLTRITQYVSQTREELRKCTWPGWEELWGSTIVVMVSTALLGVFTVVVEVVVAWVVSSIV